MEEKDDWTCGREGDRYPFTQTNLQDEFIPPIKILRTYKIYLPNFKCWPVYLSKRSINPSVKGKNVRNNVIMLHVDKQHSLRDKYV